ncbi:TPA: hypothetical protein PXE17_006465 [Pseudomonas aeruginosa]|nr:hypothetical protein [Pseudomonas aeruginosa]
MQPVIYAGLRNPERDKAIAEALHCKSVAEVAEEYRRAPSYIRAAAKRIEDLSLFELTLTGGKDMQIGVVAAKTFRRAALAAYRQFHGTFRHLELDILAITDGTRRMSIGELRAMDCGVVSVTSDDKAVSS